MRGILYGVGVGPGDPELLTLKAARLIRECDLVAVPDSGTSSQVALDIAQEHIGDKPVLHCSLPMTRDGDKLARCRQAVAKELCKHLADGQDIVFLTLGDPSIYSTYTYIQRLVLEQGFDARMVAGVPSFCAAAAALNTPLCEAGEPVHILPASYDGGEDALGLEGCKVLMKSGKSFGELRQQLAERGLTGNAKLVERCGMEGEQVVHDLSQLAENPSYFTVVIVREEA